MAQPLNARITSALTTDDNRTSNLQQLIADVTEERDRQIALHQTCSAESMNFNLDEAAQDEAAANADRAGRSAKALTTALESLDDKLVARLADENTKAKQAERDAALAERDALAVLIKTTWPVLVDNMIDILQAVVANDERMRMLGINEASAECVAREIPGNFYRGSIVLSQFTKMKIPGWNGETTAWPKPKVPFDMRAALQKSAAEIAAEMEANAPKYLWHRARVTHGGSSPFHGQFRDGTVHLGQISNGETDIQITEQEAERLNKIPGIKVTKLDEAPPEPDYTFKIPGAA